MSQEHLPLQVQDAEEEVVAAMVAGVPAPEGALPSAQRTRGQ